jgi:hypothetical protein
MKKVLMAALLSSVVLLTGCPATPEEQREARVQTEQSAGSPLLMATLPDGRAVKRIEIKIPNQYSHYVYFVDNATTSVNYGQHRGKTSSMETRVSLSSRPTADEVIEAAEQIKSQQLAADKAEFSRLKQKLGEQ